ncbi:hypothetical protein D9M68_275770 [compost metagenome]
MISANTEMARPRVAFGSVVGTTRKNRCSLPVILAAKTGRKSTGTRSIRFIRKIQTKMVRASGAISGLRPWKVSFTLVSTNSTITSTKFCSPPG